MKLDSKIFDGIRVRPRREEKPVQQGPMCTWEGCDQPATHKAPKGHKAQGEYHDFCLQHVRHYNTAYNFFAGMDKTDLDEALHAPPKPDERKSFATGQAGMAQSRTARTAGLRPGDKFGDPCGVFARYRYRQGKSEAQPERVRPIHEPDRRALEALGITTAVKSDEIKAAYKALVKIHHPDANGGDKSSEERLRTIIAAYSHLKKSGFVPK